MMKIEKCGYFGRKSAHFDVFGRYVIQTRCKEVYNHSTNSILTKIQPICKHNITQAEQIGDTKAKYKNILHPIPNRPLN